MKAHLGLLASVVIAAQSITFPATAEEAYPSRPVRLIVPTTPGGASDTMARHLGAALQKLWNTPVVIENKAGASGTIGTMEVVRAKPDGYTLILQNSTMASNLAVQGKLPYDYETDLTTVTLLGITPITIVANPSAGIDSIKKLVEQARAKPDGLTYASCGLGTPQFFAMERLKQIAQVQIAQAGYKGCSPALNDVLAGQIPLGIVSGNLAVPFVKDGRLRALAVTSNTRYRLLPETPTLEEEGFKPFDQANWSSIMGPAGLSADVVAKLTTDIQRVLGDPELRERLSSVGIEVVTGVTGAEALRTIREDANRFIELAKIANIKPE